MNLSEKDIIFEQCYCGNNKYKIFRDFAERKVIECKNCGLYRSFPLPVNSVCGDDYQVVNESQNLHYHQLFVLKNVIKFVKNKDSRILDIGCSTGNMMCYLKNKDFKNIFGIEMNEYAVKECKRKKLEVLNTDIDNLNENDKYDLIYLNHVLEHIKDLKKFIQEIKEHLFSSGFLIIAVPNIGGRKTDSEKWIGYQFEQHYWHFTPESLTKIFLENNFIVKNVYTLSGGRIESFFCKTFNLYGDSLVAIFKYDE
jgi:2-polyprenyl-3-methyl-5-hydroxy-6-metoxy-1,4-benzoquinol methylase